MDLRLAVFLRFKTDRDFASTSSVKSGRPIDIRRKRELELYSLKAASPTMMSPDYHVSGCRYAIVNDRPVLVDPRSDM